MDCIGNNKALTMQKIMTAILLVLISTCIKAQFFEGCLTYKNSYTSKLPAVTSEMLVKMAGDTGRYFIKEGSYKSLLNGFTTEWQVYSQTENKLFTKMKNSKTVYWNDAAINNDTVLNYEILKNADTVLGYTCDMLVLHCTSGDQKYIYNNTITVNEKPFKSHAYGNWYNYVSITGALPLKMILETKEFTMISEAVEVKPIKLEADFFNLPSGAILKKSFF